MSLTGRIALIRERHKNVIGALSHKLRTLDNKSREAIVRDFTALASLRELQEEALITAMVQLGVSDEDIRLRLDDLAERAKFSADMQNRCR